MPTTPAVDGASLRRAVTVLRFASLALAVASVAFVVWVGLARLDHPFELEWLEGTMADHVSRVIRGETIYPAPGVDFVPFIYPPFFFWVAAAVASIVGEGLPALRIVALVSTLGCFAMIGWIVRRETGSTHAALIAAGLFAAAFVPGGAWFDLARLDSLFILEILVAAALVRFGRGIPSAAIAGLVLAVALLTKQSAIMLAAPLGLYLVLYERRRALALIATFVVPSIVAYAMLDASSDGWYGWYVWEAPARHSYIWASVFSFWAWSLFRSFPIAALAALWYAISSPLRGNRELVFHGLLGAALIGASWLHRIHKGGFENVLLLAYVALAMLAGLAIARLVALDRDQPRVALLLHAALCIQFLALTYDPRNLIPGQSQRAAWSAIVERVRAADGPVWLPMHGHIAEQAGKGSGAHLEAVYAVQMSGVDAVTDTMRRSIVGALDSGRFALIIADRSMETFSRAEGLDWFLEALHRNYVVVDTIAASDEALMPYTGARTRPELVYGRRARR